MPTQAPEIDGMTLINDFEGAAPRPGEIRRLRITEAHDYDLVGTLLAGDIRSAPAGTSMPLIQIMSPQVPAPVL
jgi:ribosomal protein S12 methylthiotransferase